MSTRYTLDMDLKDVVNVDVLSTKDKKVTAAKETKARFEESIVFYFEIDKLSYLALIGDMALDRRGWS
ncbi:60S ribosomal protein L27 [Capsicum chinense]|nr:60S ribosomal protein L27 [Capsicum chinense]